MNERELLQAARAGDPEAFASLAGPHEQTIWRLCWRMTGHRADAEDCMQEAMLRAWQRLDTFRGEAAFGTWLYRVAAGVCADFLRRKRPAVSLDALRDEGFDTADPGPQPDAAVARRERMSALRAALDELPPEQRVPLSLCALEGRSYDEAARLTGTPVGTVKSRISRARESLVKKLRERGNFFDEDASNQVKGGRRA